MRANRLQQEQLELAPSDLGLTETRFEDSVVRVRAYRTHDEGSRRTQASLNV